MSTEFKSGDLIQKLMDEANVDRQQLAHAAGIHYQTLSKYIKNSTPLSLKAAASLSTYFTHVLGRKISIEFLMGRNEKEETDEAQYEERKEMVLVPVLGTVRAGKPLLATEHIIGYEMISAETVKNGEYFYLQITGDSMVDAKIFPGGRVLVRRQDWVDNNQIAVVLVGNEDATVKRIKWLGDKVVLYAANSNYEPQIYDVRDIKIVGRAVKSEVTI